MKRISVSGHRETLPMPPFRRASILTTVALTLCVRALAASDPIAEGDSAWGLRAGDFARTGRVSPEPVETALEAYDRALAASPNDLKVRFRLMEALYFKGAFAAESKAEAKRIFERLVDLAEETVTVAQGAPDDPAQAPAQQVARSHFWAAISWGLWGMSHSYLASGAKGVAGKIREHAKTVIALDEEFADAGGLRLLGRLHTATPKLPLFTGWIDRAEGLALLERAHEISDRDPRNALFLAEAILDFRPARRHRAVELLRDLAARVPDPDYLVEQTETLEQARRLLARLEERDR